MQRNALLLRGTPIALYNQDLFSYFDRFSDVNNRQITGTLPLTSLGMKFLFCCEDSISQVGLFILYLNLFNFELIHFYIHQ